MSDTNRLPLWREMQKAAALAPQNVPTIAAELRALRDWLIQQCRNEGIDKDARNGIYGMLTAEAEIAERGDG